METKTTKSHPLKAWVDIKDIAPTLYVAGDLKTNGEKATVALREVSPQGSVKEDLILKPQPDVYDPAGKNHLPIEEFRKKLKSDHEYKTVTIRAQNGDIHLTIELKERERK